MLVDGSIVVAVVGGAVEAVVEESIDETAGVDDEADVEEVDSVLAFVTGKLLLDVREAVVDDTIRLVAAVVQVNALEFELMVVEGKVKTNVVWLVSSLLPTTEGRKIKKI